MSNELNNLRDLLVIFSLEPEVATDAATWSGYLVTGDLAALAAQYPDDGEWTFADKAVTLEPITYRSLVGRFAQTIRTANTDRTRDGGSETEIWPAADALDGNIALKAGYNCAISQNNDENSISIAAYVGAGDGEPCQETPVYAGEVAAEGSSLLDGSLRCDEVIRSINGIGGRVINVVAGRGVSVTANTETNTLLVDVNMKTVRQCTLTQA